MQHPTLRSALRSLSVAALLMGVAGCGMKGPLTHPAPPPADESLAEPPAVSSSPGGDPDASPQPDEHPPSGQSVPDDATPRKARP